MSDCDSATWNASLFEVRLGEDEDSPLFHGSKKEALP